MGASKGSHVRSLYFMGASKGSHVRSLYSMDASITHIIQFTLPANLNFIVYTKFKLIQLTRAKQLSVAVNPVIPLEAVKISIDINMNQR